MAIISETIGQVFKFGLKATVLFPALIVAWTVLIGGLVGDLVLDFPFTGATLDLQTPLEFFANTIATINSVMPWMQPIFNIIIWGLIAKFILLLVELYWRITDIFTA